MVDFFKVITNGIGNEYAGIASDGVRAGDCHFFHDTGCLAFNALLSGSLWGGLPGNKVTAIAGPEATGKTFFMLAICKHFLDKTADENGLVVIFESESALSKKMLEERGIDTKRVMIVPVATVQEFRFQCLKILNNYDSMDEKPPMILALDSLGNLSTTKEMEDSSEGKETKDMTRAAIVKATFRVLTLKLGKLDMPLIITNHTYDDMGSMYPQRNMSGGSGIKYAASTVIFLSKRKEKDGTEVIGNIVHCKTNKSRMTRENMMVDVLLTYDKGLKRYYGLIDLAVEAGIWKKLSTKIELADGTSKFAKAINKNPEKYFTQDVLDAIEVYVAEKFLYGNDIDDEDELEILEDEVE